MTFRRLIPLLAVAALLGLAAIAPSTAIGLAWEPAGPSVAQWAFPASDGERTVAYAGDESTLHVLDLSDATAYDARIPATCATHDRPVVAAIGGGQLLVRCPAKHLIGSYAMRPLLFDLATRSWHEVAGIDAWIPPGDPATDLTLMFDAGRVGARWLELIRGHGPNTTRSWIDWRTGELRANRFDPSHAVDPDSTELYVPLCRPLSWPSNDSGTYDAPFAINHVDTGVLSLRHCGSSRSIRLFRHARRLAREPAIGGGVVSWSRTPVLRPYAYLLDCDVRLDWSFLRGIVVHAGRDLYVKQVPYGGDPPTRLLHLRLPAGCPSDPASGSLRMRAASGRTVLVPPEEAAWAAGGQWADARAQVLPGTSAVPRIVVRRGATTFELPAAATALRWRIEGGRWRAGVVRDSARRQWKLMLRPTRRYAQLTVEVVYDNGARARSIANVRAVRD